MNWGSPDDHLSMAQTDVILAFFGFNESFAGPEGLEDFKTELIDFIRIPEIVDTTANPLLEWL